MVRITASKKFSELVKAAPNLVNLCVDDFITYFAEKAKLDRLGITPRANFPAGYFRREIKMHPKYSGKSVTKNRLAFSPPISLLNLTALYLLLDLNQLNRIWLTAYSQMPIIPAVIEKKPSHQPQLDKSDNLLYQFSHGIVKKGIRLKLNFVRVLQPMLLTQSNNKDIRQMGSIFSAHLG